MAYLLYIPYAFSFVVKLFIVIDIKIQIAFYKNSLGNECIIPKQVS